MMQGTEQQLLAGKVAVVAGGAEVPGCSIVQVLLQEGATVIVPVADAASIHRLRRHTAEADPARLITYPTDFGDYDKAEELIEIIVSEFGHIDLVVAANEKIAGHEPLLYSDIRDWHTALDCNLTSSFVIDRLCIPLLGSSGGVLITISNADHLLPDAGSPLARLAGFAGIDLSRVFAEEARAHHIHFYHLIINNLAPVKPGALGEGEREITPAMIGGEVVRLFLQNHLADRQTFHLFTGKAPDAALLNRLNEA